MPEDNAFKILKEIKETAPKAASGDNEWYHESGDRSSGNRNQIIKYKFFPYENYFESYLVANDSGEKLGHGYFDYIKSPFNTIKKLTRKANFIGNPIPIARYYKDGEIISLNQKLTGVNRGNEISGKKKDSELEKLQNYSNLEKSREVYGKKIYSFIKECEGDKTAFASNGFKKNDHASYEVTIKESRKGREYDVKYQINEQGVIKMDVLAVTSGVFYGVYNHKIDSSKSLTEFYQKEFERIRPNTNIKFPSSSVKTISCKNLFDKEEHKLIYVKINKINLVKDAYEDKTVLEQTLADIIFKIAKNDIDEVLSKIKNKEKLGGDFCEEFKKMTKKYGILSKVSEEKTISDSAGRLAPGTGLSFEELPLELKVILVSKITSQRDENFGYKEERLKEVEKTINKTFGYRNNTETKGAGR